MPFSKFPILAITSRYNILYLIFADDMVLMYLYNYILYYIDHYVELFPLFHILFYLASPLSVRLSKCSVNTSDFAPSHGCSSKAYTSIVYSQRLCLEDQNSLFIMSSVGVRFSFLFFIFIITFAYVDVLHNNGPSGFYKATKLYYFSIESSKIS